MSRTAPIATFGQPAEPADQNDLEHAEAGGKGHADSHVPQATALAGVGRQRQVPTSIPRPIQ